MRITVYEACACGASFTADGLGDHLDTRSALTEWRREHQHDVTVSALRTEVERTLEYVRNADQRMIEADQRTDEARAEAERLRVEATSGPSWDAVALRSALVAMTVERDDLRAAHERLDRDGRAVAGRCLHYEARTEKADAAVARVRALCDEAEADRARGNMGLLRPPDVRAALDGEAT